MILIVCYVEDEELEMVEVKIPGIASAETETSVKWPRSVAILGHSADGGPQEVFVSVTVVSMKSVASLIF